MQTAHLNNSMRAFMSIVWSSVSSFTRDTMKHDEGGQKKMNVRKIQVKHPICWYRLIADRTGPSVCVRGTCLFVQLSVETISKHIALAHTETDTNCNWTSSAGFWLIFSSALHFIVISLSSSVIYFLHWINCLCVTLKCYKYR